MFAGFAVNGINNVNIASYERRYLLTSRDASLVASFYDVAAGLTVSLMNAKTAAETQIVFEVN